MARVEHNNGEVAPRPDCEQPEAWTDFYARGDSEAPRHFSFARLIFALRRPSRLQGYRTSGVRRPDGAKRAGSLPNGARRGDP